MDGHQNGKKHRNSPQAKIKDARVHHLFHLTFSDLVYFAFEN